MTFLCRACVALEFKKNVIFVGQDVAMAGTTSTGTAGKRANSLATFKWLYLTM